jgi:MFS transporter, ACS family, D-galactonate transporter
VWAAAEPVAGWAADTMIRRGMDPMRVRKRVIAAAFLTGLLLIPAVWVTSLTAALVLICGSSLVGFGAGNIGGILSPMVTGILIGRTGSFFAGFALAPVVLLAGLACFIFVVGKLHAPAVAGSY